MISLEEKAYGPYANIGKFNMNSADFVESVL